MADNLDEVFASPTADMPPDDASLNPENTRADDTTAVTTADTPPADSPPDTPPAAVGPERREDRSIPIDALLTEREKRQAAERRLAEIEAQQQIRQPADVPDPFDDPAGHNAYVQQQIASAVQQSRVDMSWQMAVRDYGKDKVEEAKGWALEKAKTDPVFRNQVDAAFTTEALPIDWVVQQHKRDALLSDIGENVDDWFTREAAKRGYVAQSAPAPAPADVVPKPALQPVKVPRSLASQGSAPSDIRQTASGPLAGVDALFG